MTGLRLRLRRILAPRRERGRGAFTLVELMVVIALVIVLAGGIGVALGGRGGEGAALANAQNLVASLVGATRSQAVLHQTNARLLVYAQQPAAGNPDNTRYLRVLQVVRQDPANTAVWIAVGEPVTLPAPICVVPAAPVPATHLRTGTTWPTNAATAPTSTLLTTTMSYRGQSGSTTLQYFGTAGGAQAVRYLEFGPDGTVSAPSTGVTKIALAPAVLSITTFPQFINSNTVRGLFIRRSGAVSYVYEATGF